MIFLIGIVIFFADFLFFFDLKIIRVFGKIDPWFLMENVNPFDEDEFGAMHAFLELVIWCVALLVVICTVTDKVKIKIVRSKKFKKFPGKVDP